MAYGLSYFLGSKFAKNNSAKQRIHMNSLLDKEFMICSNTADRKFFQVKENEKI